MSINLQLDFVKRMTVIQRILNVKCGQQSQCRCYQPRRLTKRDRDKIYRQTKPFIPAADHPFTKDWQLRPDVIKSYERVAWAKFGSSSGVNISKILPGKEDILEEWEAEKRWWSSLKEMQDEIQQNHVTQEKERLAYEEKIAKNMEKMPKWIEQWEREQKKLKETEEVRASRREAMTDKALEDFDYKYAADSEKIKDHVTVLREKERKEKKMKKRLAKGKKDDT